MFLQTRLPSLLRQNRTLGISNVSFLKYVYLCFNKNKQLIIGHIYRPPNAQQSTKCILSTINSLDHPSWIFSQGNWLDCSSLNDRNLFGSRNLTQLISQPTRADYRSKSLLDWILVSHPNRITNAGVLSYCFRDHSIIFCVWKIKITHFFHQD